MQTQIREVKQCLANENGLMSAQQSSGDYGSSLHSQLRRNWNFFT